MMIKLKSTSCDGENKVGWRTANRGGTMAGGTVARGRGGAVARNAGLLVVAKQLRRTVEMLFL